MAYKSNDKTTILADIPKNNRGDMIRVSRIENASGKSYDLRLAYTNDAGEVCYTQKGVRLSVEAAVAAVTALMKDFDAESFNSIVENANDDADGAEDGVEQPTGSDEGVQ